MTLSLNTLKSYCENDNAAKMRVMSSKIVVLNDADKKQFFFSRSIVFRVSKLALFYFTNVASEPKQKLKVLLHSITEFNYNTFFTHFFPKFKFNFKFDLKIVIKVEFVE